MDHFELCEAECKKLIDHYAALSKDKVKATDCAREVRFRSSRLRLCLKCSHYFNIPMPRRDLCDGARCVIARVRRGSRYCEGLDGSAVSADRSTTEGKAGSRKKREVMPRGEDLNAEARSSQNLCCDCTFVCIGSHHIAVVLRT